MVCLLQFLNIYDLVSLARAGERRPFFLKRAVQKGENFVMVNGVWATRHKDVAKIMQGSQGRFHGIGSSHVSIPKTFSPDALIFLSNPSPRHTELRGWIVKAITQSPESMVSATERFKLHITLRSAMPRLSFCMQGLAGVHLFVGFVRYVVPGTHQKLGSMG